MHPSVQCLNDRWRRITDFRLRPGATNEQISGLLARVGPLPIPFLDSLRLADGFVDEDPEGFRFWPMAEMDFVAAYDEGEFAFSGSEDYLLFADYLQWSWAYALRLRGERQGSVAMIGTADGKPYLVAEDFVGFIEKYLLDHPTLYGPETTAPRETPTTVVGEMVGDDGHGRMPPAPRMRLWTDVMAWSTSSLHDFRSLALSRAELRFGEERAWRKCNEVHESRGILGIARM